MTIQMEKKLINIKISVEINWEFSFSFVSLASISLKTGNFRPIFLELWNIKQLK